MDNNISIKINNKYNYYFDIKILLNYFFNDIYYFDQLKNLSNVSLIQHHLAVPNQSYGIVLKKGFNSKNIFMSNLKNNKNFLLDIIENNNYFIKFLKDCTNDYIERNNLKKIYKNKIPNYSIKTSFDTQYNQKFNNDILQFIKNNIDYTLININLIK